MKFCSPRVVCAAAITAVTYWLALPAMAVEGNKNNTETYQLLNLFGDVFERVRAKYVEKPTDRELIEAAITGMLTSLDPHSSYMTSKSFKDMQVNTRGEFGGLGIQVTMERGFVRVISPIDDTPAFRAGVEAGDFITHLDGDAVQGLTLSQAVDKMRGKVGTDIKLIIRRKGVAEPFEVTITRAVIKITSVRSRMEKNVGYIRITSFNEQSQKGLEKAIARFDKELGDKMEGLVLDLRNNPGGLLDQAVSVSDAFLDKGEIVSTRSNVPEETKRYNAMLGDLMNEKPIVVLINEGSASASEIVAGALQDHRRAIILGTRSFGKGSVQTIMPLPGNGAMRLTTARYYTPSGRSIQAKGIDPDIFVQQAKIESVEPQSERREADLRGALRNTDEADPNADKAPSSTKSKDGRSQAEDEDLASQDYQLARALDLLRGLSLYSGQLGKQTN